MKLQAGHHPQNDPQSEAPSAECFPSSIEHLFCEINRIDILVQIALAKARLVYGSEDQFRGLYISEDDIDRCMHEPIGVPGWRFDNYSGNNNAEYAFYEELKSSNKIAAEISKLKGIELRLNRLRELFSLSDFDIDVILVCLLVDVDLRYEIIYAYLQDDITRKYPSIDLVLDLLCQSTQDRLEHRRQFSADANLLKYRLIELVDDPARNHSGLLGKVIKLPRRIVDFLLEVASVENQLSQLVQVIETNAPADESILHPATQQEIGNLALHLQDKPASSLIYLQGAEGSGKRHAAAQIANARQNRLLQVDLKQLSRNSGDDFSEKLPLIIREALLQNADIYFSDFDSLLTDEKQIEQQLLLNALSIFHRITFIAGQESWIARSALPEKKFFHFELLALSPQQRAMLWRRMLPQQCADLPEIDLLHLADRFRFTPGQIGDAIATAQHLAATRSPDRVEIEIDQLYQACRLTTNRKLATLAKRIVPRYCWDDIILESDQLLQLRLLNNTVQHRALVYNEWGFGDKLSLGKGVNALFSGPPGTGKTMAAEIIAKSLGLELYKIDLSMVVSKYIGETEKNLARIFNEAETSNAILFFDEADALFGKRTDIKSSHDRYANVEVAYLLQKMEEYDGITILATNLRNNMDEAFVRRLAFIIRFPFPDKIERKVIWQTIWPEKTPLSEDLDLEFISSQFKLAGGNIKNIALAASFLAAEDGGAVEMKHLILSTKREFEKQGRACVAADFRQYGDLLH